MKTYTSTYFNVYPEQVESQDIKLIRVYPVYEDETDEEARNRVLQEERKTKE